MSNLSPATLDLTFKQADLLASQGQIAKAIPLLESILNVNPKHRKSQFALAQLYLIVYQNNQDISFLTNAIALLESSNSKSLPNKNPLFSITLGKAYMMAERYEQAEVYLHKALREMKSSDDVLAHLGMTQSQLLKYEEAEQHFLSALKVNPENLLAYDGLSQMYEITNQPDKAKTLLALAGPAVNTMPSILLVRAKLAIRDKQYDDALLMLNEVITKPTSTNKRIEAQFKRAFTLEKLKRYEEALAQFTLANTEKLTHDDQYYHVKQQTAYYHAVIDSLAEIELNHLPDNTGATQPNDCKHAFLVGFPRSGTTLIEQALSTHPDVTVSDEKEYLADLIRVTSEKMNRAHSYPQLIFDISPELQRQLQKHYWRSVSRDFGNSAYFLDKLPLNVIHLPLIQAIFPHAKIIMALRDPRDVCLSCFFQPFTANAAMGSFYTLADSVALYVKVLKLYQGYNDALKLHMKSYRYEDTVDNFPEQMKDMVDFMGLDWNSTILDFHQKEHQRIITTPSAEAVSKPIYKGAVNKWKHYQPFTGDEVWKPLDELLSYLNYA